MSERSQSVSNGMEKIDTAKFKQKLTVELAQVESELKSVGRLNPQNPDDWEAVQPEKSKSADPTDTADAIEDYEENTAILKQLEIRYNQIKAALARLEAGTFGVCEISGEPIEIERLEVNPAARTCIKHLDVELG